MLPSSIVHRFTRPVFPDMPQILKYFQLSIDGAMYSNFGPLSGMLEEHMVERYGFDGEAAVVCSSATSALSACLIAADVRGPVAIPAFTFPATLGAVRGGCLSEVVIDVDPSNHAMSPEALAKSIEVMSVDAAIVVIPFGIQIDIAPYIEVADCFGIKLIIDNAAGLGTSRFRYSSRPNVFEVFSMHATKAFVAGEGGVVFCHGSFAERLKSALNFGLPRPDGSFSAWGINGKLSEIHCAVALAQSETIDLAIQHRSEFVDCYRAAFNGKFSLPDANTVAPWQCVPVLLPTRAAAEAMQAACAKYGVEVRRYYRPSLSSLDGVRTLGPCVVAEDIADRMCALPVRSSGDVAERDEIVGLVLSASKEVQL